MTESFTLHFTFDYIAIIHYIKFESYENIYKKYF